MTKDIIDSIPNYIKDVIYDNHNLYHRSPSYMEYYDHNYAISIHIKNKKNSKSVLGMWASTYPYSCRSFGSFNYEIKYTSNVRIKGIKFKDFLTITSNLHLNDQLKIRKKILEICDILYIVDSSKKVNEVIIINTDKIKIKKVSSDIPDTSYNLAFRI